MTTLDVIRATAEQVAPYVRRTPLARSETLSRRLGTNVYVKLELFQKTGSFKPRGAFRQMLQLTDEERAKGVVAVSGGNFAQAAAYAGGRLGVKTVIIMPDFTPSNYIEATQGYGASVELVPDLVTAFDRVDELVAEGMVAIHAFDAEGQWAGNGGVGLEIYEDCPQITDLVISIGGGGLINGVTTALKELTPSVRIWAVETEKSPTMYEALNAGEVVNIVPQSLAKTLGAPYVGEGTLHLMQQHLHELILVSDEEAIVAQRFILERLKILTELAASCTLAAADKIADKFGPDRHVVLLLCGGNESLDSLIKYQELV